MENFHGLRPQYEKQKPNNWLKKTLFARDLNMLDQGKNMASCVVPPGYSAADKKV
jgi:hypothetical protein